MNKRQKGDAQILVLFTSFILILVKTIIAPDYLFNLGYSSFRVKQLAAILFVTGYFYTKTLFWYATNEKVEKFDEVWNMIPVRSKDIKETLIDYTVMSLSLFLLIESVLVYEILPPIGQVTYKTEFILITFLAIYTSWHHIFFRWTNYNAPVKLKGVGKREAVAVADPIHLCQREKVLSGECDNLLDTSGYMVGFHTELFEDGAEIYRSEKVEKEGEEFELCPRCQSEYKLLRGDIS